MPPQLVPPALPGNINEPRRLGGVYMPSQRSDLNVSRHLRPSQLSSPKASSGSSVVAVRGGGAEGNGCVGDVISPGTSVCGTGRSSIGNNDSPVRRSRTNRIPILVGLHQRGNVGAVALERDQRRLRRHVEVPEIVVHGLEPPRHLAGVGVERHHRGRPVVVAVASRGPVVGGRVAGR